MLQVPTIESQTTTGSRLHRDRLSRVVGCLGSQPKTYIIYQAISPSGKVYVGRTCLGLKRRRTLHFQHAKSSTATTPMVRALRKYGQALTWKILKDGISSRKEAERWERHFIAALDANNPLCGYNCTSGGEGAPSEPKTPEHRRKIRLGNARPLLRSDGVAFLSGRDANVALGFNRNCDYVGKSVRRGGLCCGYSFQRISRDEYLRLEAEGKAWSGGEPSGPHPMKGRGWSWSGGRRDRVSALMCGRPRSPEHEANHRKAISKEVFRSDGRRFGSIKEAAKAAGVSVDQLSYAIRRHRVLNGLVYGLKPVTEKDVSFVMHQEALTNRVWPIRRSDGVTYSNMKRAAKAIERSISTLSQAIKTGRLIQGFTFKKVTPESVMGSQGEKNHGLSR